MIDKATRNKALSFVFEYMKENKVSLDPRQITQSDDLVILFGMGTGQLDTSPAMVNAIKAHHECCAREKQSTEDVAATIRKHLSYPIILEKLPALEIHQLTEMITIINNILTRKKEKRPADAKP